jgi:clan AA aspartic protease
MRIIQTKITLTNTVDASNAITGLISKDEVRSMEAGVIVDTGATMLCINENIALELGLIQSRESMITLADGSKKACKIVGPVTIHFLTRSTVVEAVVLPGDAQPLLGAIPMEGMDVIIDPLTQTLGLPPDRPYMSNYLTA